MSIFGQCPAHDEFYLVVCNHCGQVVKPQAFQKHCGEPGRRGGPGTAVPSPAVALPGLAVPRGHRRWEPRGGLTPGFAPLAAPVERRHGPLSKLYARAAAAAATAAKCHVAVNGRAVPAGTPGAAKGLREKPLGARGRVQALPERPDKDNNLW